MKNEALFNDEHRATYCPEDDKLRLYVDRVPKEEYLALRAEGWKSTPKQDCDFVATWTTDREDTALSYAGIILDEDQDPADRAADRAERFSGYLDKRRAEAHGHADSYESGPQAHGYQNQQKAERAAARHDRHADRAIDAWSKAEYWQSRTAGVIRNALYKSTPGVRMGRIKKLEAEQRKIEKEQAENDSFRDIFAKIAANPDTEKANADARSVAGAIPYGGRRFKHPRNPEKFACLWDLMDNESPDPVTAKEAAEIYAARFPADRQKSRAYRHAELRLSYERQMLEAAGGRAGDIEIQTGGTFSGGVIAKVNKSPATGRAVSVAVIVPAFEGWAYKMTNTKGTDYALMQIDCERAAPGAYQEPTEASRAKLEEYRAAVKAARKAGPKKPSLLNPTPEAAEKLQAELNAEAIKNPWNKFYKPEEVEVKVIEMIQSRYSKIHNDHKETALIEYDDAAPFKVRTIRGHSERGYPARRVVILTDKPQKALPVKLEPKPEPAAKPQKVLSKNYIPNFHALSEVIEGAFPFSEYREEVENAELAGLVEIIKGKELAMWTDEGSAKAIKYFDAKRKAEATTGTAAQGELF